MPDDWMHFFAYFFNVRKSTLLKFRMDKMFPESNDDEENDGEDEAVSAEISIHE